MSAYSFASDVAKIYFYTKNDKVYAEINDRSMQNVDNLSLMISNSYNGDEFDPISVKIEVFKNLVTSKSPVKVRINKSNNVFVFVTKEDENVELKYIVSALVK
jgi:hypothetical protein